MPLILDGTKGETFPSWTTGTRPATPNTGQTGYNTSLATLETYNGTTWTPILNTRSTGSIIQVVQGTYSTQVGGTGTTFTDTGLTASITPTSSTNKVLILVSQHFNFTAAGSVNAGGGTRLLRGSTVIFTPAQDATGPYDFYSSAGGATSMSFYGRGSFSYLDSPSTTSSTTYKTQIAAYSPSWTWLVNNSGAVTSSTNTIILMEVVA